MAPFLWLKSSVVVVVGSRRHPQLGCTATISLELIYFPAILPLFREAGNSKPTCLSHNLPFLGFSSRLSIVGVMDDLDATQAAPRPTQKRSFFSKPAAPKTQPAANQEDATDFFRQSSNCFSSILHEQELKKKERLAKKLKAKANKDDSDDDIDAPAVSRKKRRISQEEEEDVEGAHKSAESAGSPSQWQGSPTKSPTKFKGSPGRKSKRDDSPGLSRRSGTADVVDLGDSSPEGDDVDDDLYAPPKSRRTPTKPRSKPAEVVELVDENQDPYDDDDISDLIAKARERKRQKDLDALKQRAGQDDNTRSGISPTISRAPPDPPVSVFISSTIQDMKPLIVRINLSKRTGELLKTWCNYNELDERRSADVFLVWRRLKQWPTTTLKRMLEGVVDFEVHDDGAITSRPGGKGDGLSDDLSKIHLVATTNEGLKQLKKDHQHALHVPSPGDTPEDNVNDPSTKDVGDTSPVKKDDNIPIVLKEPKEYGELKIKVKPDTTIERIIFAFRRSKKIPDDKTVFLMYDGEKLNAQDMMQDTEIEEKDTIEVYVR